MRQNRLKMPYLIKDDYQVIKSNQSENAKTPYFQGKLAMCRGFKSPPLAIMFKRAEMLVNAAFPFSFVTILGMHLELQGRTL